MELEQPKPVTPDIKKTEEKTTVTKTVSNSKNSGSSAAAWIFAIIFVGAASGVGGYFIGKNKAPETPKTTSIIQIDGQASSQNPSQQLTQNYPNADQLRGANYPSQNSSGNGAVLGSQTQAPQYTYLTQPQQGSQQPASSQIQNYTNKNLGFSLQFPGDWKIQPMGSDGIILISPQGNRYSVQSYIVGNNGNITDLQAFLSLQPKIHNLTSTTFNGHPANAFQIDGIYKNGVAFLSNGHLYYLLGSDVQTALLSFNTI